MRKHMTAVIGALLALPAWPGLAASLAVKPGDWEMTSTVHMQGSLMSPETMAQLPPQARAQVGAVMASMQQPHTRHTCLTAEKIQKGFDIDPSHNGHCQQHAVQRSSMEMEVSGTCATNHGDMSEHGVLTASDPETIKGHFDMVNAGGDAGGPPNVTVDVSGHWAGAACTPP